MPLTRQDYEKLIAEKLRKNQMIFKIDLITAGRKEINNNQKYYGSINKAVDDTLRKL